ncbi:MAG: hypothetical protein ACRCXD_03295, partial [Luteolibacter sp.]
LDQPDTHQRVIRGQRSAVFPVHPQALAHILGDLEQRRANRPILGNRHHHLLERLPFNKASLL